MITPGYGLYVLERGFSGTHFSIRGLFAAIIVFALLVAAEEDRPRGEGPWGDLLFCLALGGVAFQSVSAWCSRPGTLRLPPLASATFGWTALLGIPLLNSHGPERFTARAPENFLALVAGYPFAVIAFLVAGVWAGRVLAKQMTSDGAASSDAQAEPAEHGEHHAVRRFDP